MNYKLGNAQHIGSREQQEDFFAFSSSAKNNFIKHGGVLGFVADGMGGMAYGNEASQLAVKNFLRSYEAKSPADSIPDALSRALRQANMALSSLIKEKGMQPGAVGTTLSAVVLHNLDLYWVSVGDSRIYLFSNGKLTQLNECHTVANELDRDAANGKISWEEAKNTENRDALSSFLGLEHLPEIDCSRTAYRLEPDDVVIVCSDGLFNDLTDQEIAAEINHDLNGSCVRMMEKALSKNNPHQDNITVIAMALGDEVDATVVETTTGRNNNPGYKGLWVIIAVLSVMIASLLAFQLLTNGGDKKDTQNEAGIHNRETGNEVPKTKKDDYRGNQRNDEGNGNIGTEPDPKGKKKKKVVEQSKMNKTEKNKTGNKGKEKDNGNIR